MQVGRDGLRDLEAEADAHTEQVVGTEALDRILTGERLVGGLDGHRPPCAGALGVVGEDREEDVRIETLQVRIAGQVDDVVREPVDAAIAVQLVQRGEEVLRHHVPTLRALQLGALVPRVHDHEDRQREQQREPAAVQELGHRGGEEQDLDRQEHDGEHNGAELVAAVPQVDAQQDRGGDHRDGQCQAVGRRDMFRIAEQQQHGQRGHAQHHVDDRNVQLAAGTGRVTDLQMRHPVEAGGLGDHGERARNQRLGGDDAGGDRQHDGHIAHVRIHHLEERVDPLGVGQFGVVLVVQHPRALAEVVEHQRHLDERPGEVDVAAAHVAHIRVQRLGAGGRKEHGAHQRQTGGVIRTEQELDAVVRVECGEHGPVVADGYHADDRQEREPDHHHRAEDLADRFGAARLHGEQDHDDHRGDHHRQILVLGEQMLQRRQRLQAFDGGRDRHGRRQHRVRQEGRAAEHGRYDEPCAVFANQRVQSKDDSAETDIQTSQFTSHMTDSPESDTQNTFFGTQTSDSAESDTCAQVE